MELTYSKYLQLDRLLDLQKPLSEPEEHDELLFITIHQVYELWFKQLLHELDKVGRDFVGHRLFAAISTIKRARTIVKTLVGQLDILETMTPMSFSAFRDRLDSSSGFQSVQFREFEFLLGYKRPEMLGYQAGNPEAIRRITARLKAPSLVDHFYVFLEAYGVETPPQLKSKPVEEPTRPDPDVQESVLRLYREQPEIAILFELMLDLDEGLQEWRYRHVKLVERTIGNKQGTGGSLGIEFLKKSLFHSFFPDLWAVRHAL